MGQPGPDRLVLYGSLRRGQPDFRRLALDRALAWLGPCQVRGTLYDLGSYPGFSPEGGGVVHGDLFALRDRAVLAVLDAFEDYRPGDPAGDASPERPARPGCGPKDTGRSPLALGHRGLASALQPILREARIRLVPADPGTVVPRPVQVPKAVRERLALPYRSGDRPGRSLRAFAPLRAGDRPIDDRQVRPSAVHDIACFFCVRNATDVDGSQSHRLILSDFDGPQGDDTLMGMLQQQATRLQPPPEAIIDTIAKEPKDKSGELIGANLEPAPRSFGDLYVEARLDNNEFEVDDGSGTGNTISTFRLADLLLPLGIGPHEVPEAGPTDTVAGQKARWTTLSEALALAHDLGDRLLELRREFGLSIAMIEHHVPLVVGQFRVHGGHEPFH